MNLKVQWSTSTPKEVSTEGVPVKPIPQGMLLARPFRTFRTGRVFCRYTGEERGPEGGWSLDHLQQMVDFFYSPKAEPCPIDLEHEDFLVMGEVLGLFITQEEDGSHALWAIPAYNTDGIGLVDMGSKKNLYSSPTISYGTMYDARTGEQINSDILLAIALTFSPAQHKSIIDKVQLSEDKENKMKNKRIPAKNTKPIKLAEEPVEDEAKKDCKCPEGEDCDCPKASEEAPESPEEAPAEASEDAPESPEEQPAEEAPEASEDEDLKEHEPLPEEEAPEASDGEEDCQCPEGEECDCPEEEKEEPMKASKLSAKKTMIDVVSLSALKTELSALRKENAKLKKSMFKESMEKEISVLLSKGAITPAEVDSAKRAYTAEFSVANPDKLIFRPFTEVYASRAPGHKVQFGATTHGNPKKTEDSMDMEIQKLSKEKNIPYHVALNEIIKAKK